MVAQMRASLTPKLLTLFDWIKSYIAEHGYSPSYVEIAKAHELCPSTVKRHVERMAELGYVAVAKDQRQRQIAIIEDSDLEAIRDEQPGLCATMALLRQTRVDLDRMTRQRNYYSDGNRTLKARLRAAGLCDSHLTEEQLAGTREADARYREREKAKESVG